ncbi:RagB/SusD family nutrient uptake outer membrane protein [Hanamia caeni]|uniref:RagB/SusD family nutrient uptake outer membrane protein n=1 Tax=Hanamia caeni TaxID=2294116 RepID=A0A3M9N9B0_9BACT|nr:RagB/SusD family nutrient uptake outer membrane protein [Hanamia caeni]RNI33548.1 RagB/SusD family nutrient uptake outer membrane protein [Hanamia caeni]
MKSINKKIIYGLSITLIAILTNLSCNKSYLKPKPLSFYTPDQTYTTAAALQDALVACQRNLRYDFFGDGAPMITQCIFSDVAVEGTTDKSGPAQDMNVDITPDAINSKNDNADHNRIYWFWEQGFYRLKYANTVLAYINVPKWDTTDATQLAERNALVGAAYFFRAYTYYVLTNCFGDVPYAGKLYSGPKLDFQTVDRKVILQEMKKELEWAVQWVPDGVPKGQVSKGACQHLLAKIDLCLGDFDGAIAAASSLIDGGVYHLMQNRFGGETDMDPRFADTGYNVIWDLHRPLNKVLPANTEGLFYVIDLEGYIDNGDYSGGSSVMRQTVPNWDNKINTPLGHTGTIRTTGIEYDQQTAYGRGIGRCRGTWYSTHDIWNNDDGDLRHSRQNWMRMEDMVYNNPKLIDQDDPYYGKNLQLYSQSGALLCSDTIRCWYDWPQYKTFVPDHQNSLNNGGHTPWYVYRLAETYLVRAEAYFWKGDLANAAADINVVRERAHAQPIDAGDVTIATILDERARELYYEEYRKVELTRIAYIYAQTGQADYKGRTYSMSDFSTKNFWYDWIMDHTEFYNKGVHTIHGDEYTLSPYHVLWPIPQSAIDANVNGHINQNQGYSGSAGNVPPLETLPED